MDTQDLDIVLTEWGRQARATAGHQPMPALTPRARRPRHFGWQLAAAAVAVALAAAATVGLPRVLAKNNADPLRGITSTASAPPGFQVVTFHGLSITVPASWDVSVGSAGCVLSRSVVELPGWSNLCGRRADPDVTVVDLGHDTAPPLTMEVTSTSHTSISGLPAIRTDGVRNGGGFAGRSAFNYSIPALQASVTIMPATDQIARELEVSLRVDAVDVHGCRSRVTDVSRLPSHPITHRSGLAQALVPDRPASVSVCRYGDGWLEQGALLSGAAAQRLTATLDRLPAGLSRSSERAYVRCPGDASPVDALPADDSEAYRLQARYPDGPPVVLIARLSWCGDLGISNGARTGQRTQDLVTALADILGPNMVENAIPTTVTPAP